MDTTVVIFYPEQKVRKLHVGLWNHLYAAVQGGENSELSKKRMSGV